MFAAQGIYGSWKFLSFDNGPLHGESVLTIGQNSTTETITCSMDGQSVSVSATAAAVVTSSQLTITEKAHSKQSLNGLKA